jgi:ABC-type nitrate/sulfonate/bicarbonate transport system substrate-binding protein
MRKTRLSTCRAVVAVGTAAVVAALAVAAQATPKASVHAARADDVTVKMAVGPYLDYMPWLVAHQLGIDKQFGLDISATTLQTPQLAGPQLRRGDLDVAYSCQACNFAILKQIPELRDWMITNQFKGFAVIGRKGQTKAYEQFAKGSTPIAARRATLKQFEGAEFVMVSANFKALLDGALSEVGLDPSQVKIIDFADDSKAALAFIRGTGDYYMGSLPQETKMLQDSPDKFVKVGGHEILGPGGLWYSTAIALQPWLEANSDTALRLMGVWYRTMRYLKERQGTTVPLMTKYINERAAAKFDPATVKFLINNLISFATLQEAAATTFNPSSIAYNARSVNHYAKGNAKVLPADYKASTYFVEGPWFKKFQARKDLIKMVNAPLK